MRGGPPSSFGASLARRGRRLIELELCSPACVPPRGMLRLATEARHTPAGPLAAQDSTVGAGQQCNHLSTPCPHGCWGQCGYRVSFVCVAGEGRIVSPNTQSPQQAHLLSRSRYSKSSRGVRLHLERVKFVYPGVLELRPGELSTRCMIVRGLMPHVGCQAQGQPHSQRTSCTEGRVMGVEAQVQTSSLCVSYLPRSGCTCLCFQ